ncbi:hypothetical protein F4818DRAFT_409919 [Hypoxylon cercidicola]|nr:hypothetical protein F4818DRAFT_409919 [Hypoxylon cercidicola]
MESFPISTPSPPTRVHTPGSPKFGYNDSWEPYTPRKSARISAQRANHRTPSPRASSQRRSRASTKPTSDASTPTKTSPQKKRQPAMDSVRRAQGAFTARDTSATSSSQHKSKPSTTTARGFTMLPTPAKTPQKQPDEKMKANVRAVARNLFSHESDTVATPKRKSKKYSGLTLDSFTAEEIIDPIEIFTDSRDRVPEVDNAGENPFYGDYVATPVQTRAKGKQVSIPGEGKQDMDKVLHREDGIVYVFRGKKIFRKFSTGEEEESASHIDGEDVNAEFGTATSRKRLRPVTRSSIKPRLLFPPEQKDKQPADMATHEDEEAATDIEEHNMEDVEEDQMEEPVTPVKGVDQKLSTPVAPKFALSSPPSTVRTTRTTSKVHADSTPLKPPKSHSPFDGWRRSKSRAGPHGQKREGETLTRPHDVSKRHRA